MESDKNNEASPQYEKLPVTEKILEELKKMNVHLNNMNNKISDLNVQVNSMNGQMTSMNGQMASMNGQMISMNGHVTNIDKNLNRVEGKVDLLLHDKLQGENTDNQIEANLIEEPNKFELKKEPEIEIKEPPKMKLEEEPKEEIKEGRKTNEEGKDISPREINFHIKRDNNRGDEKGLFQDENENKIVFFGKDEKDSPISITNNSNANSINAASIPEDIANYQNVSDSSNKSKKMEDLPLGRNRIKINTLDRDHLKKNRSFKKVAKKEEKRNNQPTFKRSIKEKKDIFGIKEKKTSINERTKQGKKIEKKDVVKTLSKGTSIIPNAFPFKF